MFKSATTPLVRPSGSSPEDPVKPHLGPRSSITAADMLSSHHDAGDKSHPSESSQKEPTCFLLDISGEVRNRIYREVLVQPDFVDVGMNGYERPALLHTCKQIREEATSIFLQENVFVFTIDRFDSTPIIRFWYRTPSMALVKGPVQQRPWLHDQSPNWQNLEEWLRLRYRSKCLGLPPPQYILQEGGGMREMTSCVIGGMFEIVNQAKAAGLPWSIVKKTVEGHRPILIALNKEWALDLK